MRRQIHPHGWSVSEWVRGEQTRRLHHHHRVHGRVHHLGNCRMGRGSGDDTYMSMYQTLVTLAHRMRGIR